MQPSIQEVHIPAPVGGLNTISAGTAMPPGDCVQLVNMVSGEHGLRARLGYKQHSAVNAQVRTLMPYVGGSANGSKDRLFAVTSQGIEDVTASTATNFVGFGSDVGAAGFGVCHAFTTAAGNFLAYCDEVNGLYVYTESTGAWTKVTEGVGVLQVSNVNPANFCFVMVWKSRLWFVEKDTNNVWYLAAGAISGAATKLPLAQSAQFRQGGDVIGLWNWTLDGGSGIDDFLVACTRGGDVAVYQGTDPASPDTFALKGTWNAGAFVAGRRVATSFGGDVMLLTRSGLRQLSQLVAGGDGQQTYATAKISNLFNALTLQHGDKLGWAIYLHPEENALIVTVPKNSDVYGQISTNQLVLSLWNRSWSRYESLPISAACTWGKKLYFGDTIGSVFVNDGYVDAVMLADPTDFDPVHWAVLTPFSNLGTVRKKQVQLLRPTTLSDSTMDKLAVEARYDYDLSGIADQTEAAASGNVWGVALWDAGTWTDDSLPASPARGATGLGSKVAVSLKGTARSRTTLVGVDVLYTTGGYL